MKQVTFQYAAFNSAIQLPKKREKKNRPLDLFGALPEINGSTPFTEKEINANIIDKIEKNEYVIPGTWQ